MRSDARQKLFMCPPLGVSAELAGIKVNYSAAPTWVSTNRSCCTHRPFPWCHLRNLLWRQGVGCAAVKKSRQGGGLVSHRLPQFTSGTWSDHDDGIRQHGHTIRVYNHQHAPIYFLRTPRARPYTGSKRIHISDSNPPRFTLVQRGGRGSLGGVIILMRLWSLLWPFCGTRSSSRNNYFHEQVSESIDHPRGQTQNYCCSALLL